MSILSASKLIGAVLTQAVGKNVTAIFPVIAAQNAILPYICYYRESISQDPVKNGLPGASSAVIKIHCCTSDYGESVVLAEAVKAALDCKSYIVGELRMRSCTLAGASEAYDSDAFIQTLTFNVKINE